MCNLSWTPHSNLEKDNSLNHSCVSPNMGCLEYTVTDGDFVSFMVLFLSTCVVYFIMRRVSMRDWVLNHYTSALPNCFSAPFELGDRRWRTS